jgi:hypothetical protein
MNHATNHATTNSTAGSIRCVFSTVQALYEVHVLSISYAHIDLADKRQDIQHWQYPKLTLNHEPGRILVSLQVNSGLALTELVLLQCGYSWLLPEQSKPSFN